MFKKILIANRGEIAVRIMATCREMGIRTVAVYSDADRSARHVREADETYAIGPAPAAQSYLRIDTLIDVAKSCGAEAIHPGYGFLSENPAFVAACEQANIVFIGPPASAMQLMGSKIAAKQIAQSVGAPTVPGYNGSHQDENTLFAEAQNIGFPLLIKASAGGGGKGMRTVTSPVEFAEQLAGARREARSAFGDETVFLERLIQSPRHIEIQILGDRYGNLIHLGERECSIQRRHQKIIEESPSIALTPALRAEMGAAAVRIAQAAGYVNAGTLEFMLDQDNQFYFLEMNTRLQVEHPVTELVTGLDLVRHQLLIAAGEPLALTQSQITQRGHAIEVRLYAENPAQNFLPSTGTITHFAQPQGPSIRIDSGIESGDEITQFYDPMIAKLIVSAEDRPAAIARLQHALTQSAVLGVTTNISLLHAISQHPAFLAGDTHTSFLEVHNLLTTEAAPDLPDAALIAAALYDVSNQTNIPSPSPHTTVSRLANHTSNQPDPWQTLGPWRMIGHARLISYTYHDQLHQVALTPSTDATNSWHIKLDEQPPTIVQYQSGNEALITFRRGPEQSRAYIAHFKDETQVALSGRTYHLRRRQPPNIETTAHGGAEINTQKTLTAPMAGTIVKVQAHDGEAVQARQTLVILSAMKMEHAITAPYAGTVRRIFYQEGAVVPGGAVIVEME